MADDLGARLVQAGLVTRGQLAEVLGAAPAHEGALVVGLVDRGLAQDAVAGFFVAAGFGPLMERRDLAAADPRATCKVPPSMAVQLYAMPVRLSPAGLVVAMAAPTDVHAVSEIARATHSPVLPAVARVEDLRRAIRAAYPNAPPSNPPLAPESEPPVLELVQVRSLGQPTSNGGTGRGAYRGSTRGAERVEARASVGARSGASIEVIGSEGLDDDAGFVPLVRHKPVREPTRGYSLERKVVTKTFEKVGAKEEKVVPVGERRPDEGWARGPSSRPPARPLSAPSIISPEHERWESTRPLDHQGSPNEVASRRLGRVESRRPPPPSPVARLAPIGATLAAIRSSRSRDEVVDLACRAGLTVCAYAVVLAVRKNLLKGIGGAGANLSRDAVRNLWIPTSSPSMFREVLALGKPYRGRPGTTAADGLFRAAVGSRGGVIALQPVTVRGRVVAILAADNVGHGDRGLERIEVLATAMGEAFERLILASRSD